MERLKSAIYKFAVLIAMLSLVTSILGGVSVTTSLIRSAVVFLLTLVVVVIVLNVIRRILLQIPHSSTELENGEE
jgi:hypothetical protein